MPHICDNERCTYHQPIPERRAKAPSFEILEDGERVLVDRFLYRSRDGKRELFLCDVCHAAVQLVAAQR